MAVKFSTRETYLAVIATLFFYDFWNKIEDIKILKKCVRTGKLSELNKGKLSSKKNIQ